MKRFRRWLSKGSALVFGLLLAGSFSVPFAFAEDQCECFCGDQKEGALSGGSFESANECAQFCSDLSGELGGIQYIGCFVDESQYPQNSNLCWTEDECKKYPVKITGNTYYGTWGDQSPYCSKAPVTEEKMGYCYGPLIPVVLNVPIMGVTEISALGEYVNLLYEYAIPLAGIFGALMFTIAGFQYMTAGGDKGAVSKAKARMTNTVTGIILIMSVYAVAYLIDPRLTRFNELRPPLVKEAVIVDDATTCEAMFRYGFCIDGICPSDNATPAGTCGLRGKITGDNEVELNIANPPEVGEECLYSGCEDNSESCVLKGDKSGGVCAACDDVSSLNEDLGIVPSSSTCAQIASKAQARENNENIIYSCFFDNDFSNPAEADAIGTDECVQLFSSSNEYIDCLKISDYAAKEEDGCNVYEEYINAKTYGLDGGYLALIFNMGNANQVEDVKNVFGSFCEADFCQVADKGTVRQGGCNFVDSSTLEDMLDSVPTILSLFDVFESYGCVGTQALVDAEAAAETAANTSSAADEARYETGL